MSYWVHPEAEAELEEAALYLTEHASSALAEALLLEYERVVGLLVQNQQRGPHSDFGMRLYHLDRFHYTSSMRSTRSSAPRYTQSLPRRAIRATGCSAASDA